MCSSRIGKPEIARIIGESSVLNATNHVMLGSHKQHQWLIELISFLGFSAEDDMQVLRFSVFQTSAGEVAKYVVAQALTGWGGNKP